MSQDCATGGTRAACDQPIGFVRAAITFFRSRFLLFKKMAANHVNTFFLKKLLTKYSVYFFFPKIFNAAPSK
jgi:hypothetical protein